MNEGRAIPDRAPFRLLTWIKPGAAERRILVRQLQEEPMDGRLLLGGALVWLAIFVVPIAVYGAFAAVTGLKPPGSSPALFLVGTAVSKLGVAIAFVGLFHLGREVFGGQWLLYAGLWWVMFVIGEAGQAIGPDYSVQEAAAGVISETIYFPLSALIVNWLGR
jgi:hypothetical protein